MLKVRIMKKIVIILIIISLLNANLHITLLGLFSYAVDDSSNQKNTIKLPEVTHNTIILPNEEETQKIEDNTDTNNTITKAEIGIDEKEISTIVENKLNFTITMYTDKEEYDLYKNPYFIIEMPKEIEKVNIQSSVVINNRFFEVGTIEQGISENGNNIIKIELHGEQTEHTNSVEENTQIVLETLVTTNQVIPTMEREIILHYKNDNAKQYERNEQEGRSNQTIKLVSNKTIITETKAILGENNITSLNYTNITVEPNTYKEVGIIGTAINNTGKDINNAKIIGTATNIGKLSGIENVYYTENAEANENLEDANNGWSKEYTNNAKKYLIVVENFVQGQIITFQYNINLPENIEDDINHIAEFAVYNNSEILKTSKMTIHQKAEQFNVYEDENIKVELTTDLTGKIEVSEEFKTRLTIINKSEEKIQNTEIEIKLPEGLKTIANHDTTETIKADVTILNNNISIKNLEMENRETVIIENNILVTKYVEPTQEIQGTIKYGDIQKEILEKVQFVEPSNIVATITSDKIGKILEDGETIKYLITLKNLGESHAKVNLDFPELSNMNIVKIEAINLATGDIQSKTSGNLAGEMSDIFIAPNEIVEITVVGMINGFGGNIAMYAEITGDSIKDVTTTLITNEIKVQEEQQEAISIEEPEEKVTIQEPQEEQILDTNIIQGVAWIDKNENGVKDRKETLLKNIQVILIDTNTSERIKQTTTNNEGEYTFKDIEDGTYVVEFKYNTDTFSITEYRSSENIESQDSDVIRTTQNNETTSKTEVVEVQKGKNENVNIGLVLNKKFDVGINKRITKVTIDNEEGMNTYNFDNTSMAKVEIDGKEIKGSLILVEYEIEVMNNGEVAGYAKLISDKVPEGMKFNSELNKDWYEGTDGMLYCEAFANNKLQPGEKAKIKLILTKEMTDDKVISPVNNVKLAETYNEYLIEDSNKENDSSEATIIISIKTGKVETYVWLALVVIAIISTGIFGVIKIAKEEKS